MALLAAIIWVYLLGAMLTLLLFTWVARQHDCWLTFGEAFKASALWFAVLPLAVVVITRLREFLPYMEAVASGAGFPVEVSVNVVSPPRRITDAIKALGPASRVRSAWVDDERVL